MRDIADLVGLKRVRTARNGAKGTTIARICADVDRKEKYNGTAVLLSHYKKLSNGDRVAGGTRRAFETQRREAESEFVDFRRR